jgi:uncharacterized protein (DUF2164 family)
MIGKNAAIHQISKALEMYETFRAKSKHEDCSDLSLSETNQLVATMAATIDRVSPPESTYKMQYLDSFHRFGNYNAITIPILAGILRALKVDYEADFIVSFTEIIHADVFSDFLEMSDYFLNEGYKDAAAIMAGGVLEEHLRKLAEKHKIDTVDSGGRFKKADRLNSELTGKYDKSKLDQKSIIAWLDLRNKAAHAKYGDYSKEQVSLMIHGVRDFLLRNPA